MKTCQNCMNYKPANDGDCQNEKEKVEALIDQIEKANIEELTYILRSICD